MRYYFDRNGKIGGWYTQRGHRPVFQTGGQGTPLNNHQPRSGTKQRSSHSCRCDWCMNGTRNKLRNRIALAEMAQERDA